ncbi:MAG: class I SAM-dependent methyltransferase [Anaerolineales bacterium]|nr:class I SAM-dependent methyltransferase [Anaerolineales bacterium]
MNKTDLIKIHHADYLDDIHFWTSWTEGKEPVLEVGCGHGRVALPLLAAGREVVGVDIDLPAIQSLRDDLEKKEMEIQNRARIIHENIVNFQPEGRFGAAIIPCNTYSTFPLEERQIIISKIYQLLAPGGIFAASMPNPLQLRSLYEELRENSDPEGSDLETSFLHPETGFPVQVSSKVTARENSLGWDWIYDHLHPDGQVERVVQSTEHYLTTLEIYQQELVRVGFDEIHSMGDFDSSDYLEDSSYLILVGNKAEV